MKSIEQLWRRAERYLAEGQVAPAQAVLESVLARDPNQPQAHLVLGGIAWKQDKVRESTARALAASQCELRLPDLVCDVIAALVQVGETALASRLFDHPLLASERLPVSMLMRLSGQAQLNGEHVRSLGYLERARRAGAGGAEFQSYLGVQLSFNGRLEEAERELESCVRLDPTQGRAQLILSRLRKQLDDRNHLDIIGQALRKVAQGSESHASLEFAQYKELEDLGRHAEAWQSLITANRIMRGLLPHDAAAEAARFARLVDESSRWSDKGDRSACSDGPQPIFIVGMPRSGTTLLSRVVGNHSNVADAGELADFGRQLRWAVNHCTPAYPDSVALDRLATIDFAELGQRYLQQTQWRAGDKPFYIDKLPANWALAGLIARALPHAPILCMARDPMDVCFSNFRAMFGDSYPYSYELDSLGRHYRNHRKVLEHWQAAFPERILELPYQDLVENAEGTARRIFDFCGLAFEPGCADVTRNRGAVATLSMVQVREPIHARFSGQWRPYEEWLEPLRAALAARQ